MPLLAQSPVMVEVLHLGLVPALIAEWARVEDDASCPHLGPCVCWTRPRLSRNGYGRIWDRGKERVVHRVVYEYVHGVMLPRTTLLDHLCRQRLCIRPSHLEPVSAQVNTLRGQATLFRRAAEYKGGE